MVFGATVWLTGLSGSGKTTIAYATEAALNERGIDCFVIDGDDLRSGLNADLGFSHEDRAENVRRLGEVALLFARSGHVSLVTAISPYRTDRDQVKARHRESGIVFVEAYVSTSLATCEGRDPKGLYARARAGEIGHFTGVTDPYEVPEAPDVTLNTESGSPAHSAEAIVARLEAVGFSMLV
jgi:bifunctional enzyme CysN/CysC